MSAIATPRPRAGRSAPEAPTPDLAAPGWTRIADTVIVAILALVAIIPFRSLFDSLHVLVLAAGAVAVALVLNVLVRKLPVSAAVVAGVLAITAYVMVAVFEIGIDSERSPGSVWKGVSGSWADLLTATVPARSLPELVVLPVVVAWIAAEAGVLLALRVRSATLPIVPSLVAFGTSLFFTGGQGSTSPAIVAGLVALSLLVVLLRANLGESAAGSTGAVTRGYGLDEHGRSLPLGHLRLGLVIVPVVTAGAALISAVGLLTTEHDRVDLHDHHTPDVELSDAVSPLAFVRPGLNDPSQTPVFTVRFTGVLAGMTIDRIPIALLDTYNGTTWSTSAAFSVAGNVLPAGDPVHPPATDVGQDYTLVKDTSSFAPALERPASVSGTPLGFDRLSGMLVLPDGDHTGVKYHVESKVPDTVTAERARDARPGNAPDYSRLSVGPNGGEWPQPIRDAVVAYASTRDRYDRLKQIEEYLRSGHFAYNDTQAVPGHSLAVIQSLLTAAQGSAVGYAEQFAAAFAILARVEGMPSRVVVGYRIRDPSQAASGAEISVLPKDIHAWAEVHFNGVGWVTFDPTETSDKREPPPEVVPTTVSVLTPDSSSTTGGPSVTVGQQVTLDKAKPGSIPWGPIAVLLVLCLVPVAIVVGKWLLRKRRRTVGTAARRTVGAWYEARDRLRSNGQPIARGSSVGAAAEAVDERFIASLQTLAPIVDEALYAPDEPHDEVADAAWEAEAAIAEDVGAASSPSQRVRASLDPRPLLPMRRRS